MKLVCNLLFWTLFSIICCANDVESGSFKVVRGGYGDKPLIWFKPKEDVDGKTPVDVMVNFLNSVKDREFIRAEQFCIPVQEFDNRPTRKYSLKEAGRGQPTHFDIDASR
jgi:hypothetical protein